MLGPFPTPMDEATAQWVPAGRLDELARQSDALVRTSVACHPSTRAETLAMLAQDVDEEVRGAVARNPMTPEAALRPLAIDREMSVRCAVVQNPACSPEFLSCMAADNTDRELLDLVAGHINCPPELLGVLGTRASLVRAVIVASNVNAGPAQLAQLDPSMHSSVSKAIDANRERSDIWARDPESRERVLGSYMSGETTRYRFMDPNEGMLWVLDGREAAPPQNPWQEAFAGLPDALQVFAWGLVREGFEGDLPTLAKVAAGCLAEA